MGAEVSLRVSDEAFAYLVLQRGSLDHLKHDRSAWESAYRQAIDHSYQGMKPHLPRECRGILDVGAGLGGIDILLARHYDHKPRVTLLDGEDDPPKMERHALTFGNRQVAMRFQQDNGCLNVDYLSPVNLRVRKVDLVVSTGAWCFHIPPDAYLSFVRQCCHPGATLITDVRNENPHWLKQLAAVFTPVAVVAVKDKRTRWVLHART